MNRKPETPVTAAQLRRRAEACWSARPSAPKSDAGTQRLLHELEVHQIELEMQNAELQKARDDLEVALEKYTDLYDFAPVGYFSIDESSAVLEANLTGAALLGIERSRLINRRLLLFVSPITRPLFLAFLKIVFTGRTEQVCEVLLRKEGGGTFWAGFRATSAVALKGTRRWCRVAFGDITARKQAEEAQHRLASLAAANQELKREIVRRQAVEEALRQSEQDQSRLLEQSRHMQEQLRFLSRQVLLAQEEERKKISRELHDVIAQTLTGINVRLAALKKEAALNTTGLERSISRTQQLVEHSVKIIHQFARELRPAVLDDLGLVPALHSFMKGFTKETGLHIRFRVFTPGKIEQLNNTTRTVFYRVAQEALTNVARHAHASAAEVKIQKLDGAVRMTISDNGKGFREQRSSHSKRARRLGLLGMRERLEMVGGKFTVSSAPGKGTTVLAQIPLANRHNEGGGVRKIL